MQHFQNKWVVHLLSTEFVVDSKGNVHQVCCVIYSKVEGKVKLLVLKFDNLLKHAKPKFLVQRLK
jgi:beta-galactosidase beta subunit